jgi:sulfatase modifying factor 1
MIALPAGWFWMGSDGHYSWESPRHRVFLDAFEISSVPVTRREYHKFLSSQCSEEPRGWNNPEFADPDQPVVGVNWFDATSYCEWLTMAEVGHFRLPTEAEWEMACRGGLDGQDYAWGNEPPETFAYFRNPWPAPRPVAQFQANAFGLFNLGDNVHEWCSDWFAPDYYVSSPERNPNGPESGTRRVSRGGSWRHQIKASRAAHRSSLPPEYRYTDYGFRVVKVER